MPAFLPYFSCDQYFAQSIEALVFSMLFFSFGGPGFFYNPFYASDKILLTYRCISSFDPTAFVPSMICFFFSSSSASIKRYCFVLVNVSKAIGKKINNGKRASGLLLIFNTCILRLINNSHIFLLIVNSSF